MEPRAYVAGVWVTLPLFRVGGVELPGSLELFGGAKGFGGIELREEAGLDWGLGSTPMIACHLAGWVLASNR